MNRSCVATALAAVLLLGSACAKSDESKLRAELRAWSVTPYAERGTTRDGISNPGLVRALFHDAFAWDIPASRDEQFHTGKLVDRSALQPGDLVFLQAKGLLAPRSVAIYLGHDEIALADKRLGVTTAKLSDPPWNTLYNTARHIIRDSTGGAPNIDVAKYGSNTSALLREIAKSWSGTLYKDNGTTFDGIGNFEYVRAIYEAIYDTELDGAPANWAKMGEAVKRDELKAGDIILYQAVGIAGAFGRLHAGMYIGDGDFTHCVKGIAVTTSKLDDPKWKLAYRMSRRIDHDELTRQQTARALAVASGSTGRSGGRTDRRTGRSAAAPAKSRVADRKVAVAPDAPRAPAGELEERLRSVTEEWRGTRYKLGGETKAGVDCSAFARAVFREALSVELPRTAAEQERLGAKVDRASLVTGDLVFFRTQGMGPFFKSRHVGVYLGAGEFAQASGSKGVTISRLDDYYWNRKYEGARRMATH